MRVPRWYDFRKSGKMDNKWITGRRGQIPPSGANFAAAASGARRQAPVRAGGGGLEKGKASPRGGVGSVSGPGSTEATAAGRAHPSPVPAASKAGLFPFQAGRPRKHNGVGLPARPAGWRLARIGEDWRGLAFIRRRRVTGAIKARNHFKPRTAPTVANCPDSRI